MKRQFLRVYIGIAVVLVTAAVATHFTIEHEVRSLIDRRVEDMMDSMVNGVREDLAVAADDPKAKERVVKHLKNARRLAARLMPLDQLELPKDKYQRLLNNETVFLHHQGRCHAYARLNDSEALVIERLPRPRPFPRSGNWPRWLQLLRDDYFLLAVLLTSLFLIGTAVYLLLRPFERRIYALADVANRFGQGQLDSRAPDSGRDAIGAMAGAFNGMADHIESFIARQKELLRAVSHEFRTPLARLFFLVDDAQGTPDPNDKDRLLGRIEDSLQDLNGLVEELLAFVRLEGNGEPPDKEQVEVAVVLADMPNVAADLRPGLAFSMPDPSVQIQVIPHLFKRAVLNLVTNAVRHAEHQVELSWGLQEGHLIISVDDDGPGIPPQERERIFEPFFRLDKSRQADSGGVGLGLAIVQRIMSLHEGRTTVEESPLGGTRISLFFPVHSQ
jgi:two-component system sensor histidine kinase RstB